MKTTKVISPGVNSSKGYVRHGHPEFQAYRRKDRLEEEVRPVLMDGGSERFIRVEPLLKAALLRQLV